MTTCLVIAAVISCTFQGPRPTPAEAVRVLTSSIPQYIAAWPRVWQDTRPAPHDPNWPFRAPATPIQPLAPPWSVTTYYGRNHVETFFNGQSFTRPGVGVTHVQHWKEGDYSGPRSRTR
jgi:hypothetical protein